MLTLLLDRRGEVKARSDIPFGAPPVVDLKHPGDEADHIRTKIWSQTFWIAQINCKKIVNIYLVKHRSAWSVAKITAIIF